ncbi:MAG: RHS repeat-associated core domain-containing protein, partial [Planctomycetaceae bacterium]|nr:RHS repeat-associated core domain-containing protein [Planctomycetaceae bacterium]
DDLVLREKGEERLYSLADPNWNVVAICSNNGVVQERYTYDAFGKRNVFDVNFTAKTETAFNWNRAFTGQVGDNETGLMLFRNRYYHMELGRFIQKDPIGYNGSDKNLLKYVVNSPVNKQDMLGLFVFWSCTPWTRTGAIRTEMTVSGFNIGPTVTTNPAPIGFAPIYNLYCERTRYAEESRTCAYYSCISNWFTTYTREVYVSHDSWTVNLGTHYLLGGTIAVTHGAPIGIGIGGTVVIHPNDQSDAEQECIGAAP